MTTVEKIRAELDKYDDTDLIKAKYVRQIIDRYAEQEPKLLQALEMEKGAYNALVKNIQCEDAISRQAVLDTFKPRGIAEDVWQECHEYRVLSSLPPVRPQELTGHWIEHPEIETSTPEYLMFYECSECEDKQCFYKTDIHKKRFCTNCGARMVEQKTRGWKADTIILDEDVFMSIPYEPQGSIKKVNCKSTKCDNCINHNYCDFEPQESEESE